MMARLHEGLTPSPLRTVTPAPQVVLGPRGSGDSSIVEDIFRDVVEGMQGRGTTPRGANRMPGDDL